MTGEWVRNSRGLLRWIPPRKGHVRIWSGVNAEARHHGVLDGYHGNPPRPRDTFPNDEAAEVYRIGYLEYFRGEIGLFPASDGGARRGTAADGASW